MRKSFTTFSRLTSDVFNLHKLQGNGVASIGQVSVYGSNVIISSYMVQYNGIIVEETTPQVISFTDDDVYVCIYGINASETSTPTIEARPSQIGVTLLERTGDAQWRSIRPVTVPEDVTAKPFRRVHHDGKIYLSASPCHTRGSEKLVQIKSIDQIPLSNGSVTNSLRMVDYQPWDGVVLATCKNCIMYTDGTDTYVGESTRLVGVVPTLGSLCVINPSKFGYAYCIANTVYIDATGSVNPRVIIELPFDPIDIALLSATEIVAQNADGLLMQASFISNGSLSNVRTSTIADTFFVNNGHLSFTDVSGDVYMDWKYIKPAHSGTSLALNNTEEIIEIDSTGHIIQNGWITSVGQLSNISTHLLGDRIFIVGEKGFGGGGGDIMGGIGGMGGGGGMGGISSGVFYDTKRYTISESISTQSATISVQETDINYIFYSSYLKSTVTNVVSGTLDEPVCDVTNTESSIRYGQREQHIRGDVEYVTATSNTKMNVSDNIKYMNVGSFSSGIYVEPYVQEHYTILNMPSVDGDRVITEHGYEKAYACESLDGTEATLVAKEVTDDYVHLVSGNIYMQGGSYNTMMINAVDSIIVGATIGYLQLGYCRNVLFVGCNINNYDNFNDDNTYKFIGCSVNGIEDGTFLALSDTPSEYGSNGQMLVTTTSELEYSVSARQSYEGLFECTRKDMIDGDISATWCRPASIEMHETMGDPTGFENVELTSLSYNSTTNVLVLSTGTIIFAWFKGTRFIIPGTIAFTHDPNTDCYMYLQYSGDDLVPITSTSGWAEECIHVAYILDNVPFDARHGITMDSATREYLHSSFGLAKKQGFDLIGSKVPYVNSSSNKVQIGSGDLTDADTFISNPGHPEMGIYNIYHQTDTGMKWLIDNNYPYHIVSGYACANTYVAGSWGLRPASSGTWINVFFFATASIWEDYAIACVPGRMIHTSLQSASIETMAINNFTFLYKAIYYVAGIHPAAQGRAKIVGLNNKDDSHEALTGRDLPEQHPATSITYNNPLLTCTNVFSAIEQVLNRTTGQATWESPSGPFVHFNVEPSWSNASYGFSLISLTADILGMTAEGEITHRKIVATIIKSGPTYHVGNVDGDIYCEDSPFTQARSNPSLIDGMNDYIEVYGGAKFGITCAAVSNTEYVTYSVNIVLNEVFYE